MSYIRCYVLLSTEKCFNDPKSTEAISSESTNNKNSQTTKF